MDKCSFAPEPCVSFEESLKKKFDNPSLLLDRLKGLRSSLLPVAEEIHMAIKNHDRLRAYCDVLGEAALTTCAIHQNPGIPIDQGALPRLYRYHQPPEATKPSTALPKHPESPSEVTTILEPHVLREIVQSDIATADADEEHPEPLNSNKPHAA